jgi:NTP pyrophosphatase (non-canonical NTP hydrolase)
MSLEKISREIYEFQKNRASELKAKLTPELVFLHLSEEIGEIARQLVNKNIPIRKYEPDNLVEEIIQAMMDLLVLCRLFKIIHLERALSEKLEEMKKRAKFS